MDTKLWDRRSVLRVAALGGLTAGVVGGAALPASARPKRFDLSAPAQTLYSGAPLSSVTVQQAFAFEPRFGRLFVAQLLAGSPGTAGDLRISEMSTDGQVLGWMTLLGYGHAVSFGVHRTRTGGLDLWVEGEANQNGYGTVLKQVPWQHDAVLDRDDPQAKTHRPVPEALEYTCAIDHRHRRMALRYHTDAGKRLAIVPLAEMLRGEVPERIADFPQPEGLGTFQGYALDGEDLYTIDGNSYSDTNPYPGNTYLSRIEWRTGELVERVHNLTADSLDFREPEGLAIGPNRRPWLHLGFASGETGDRRSNLYFLDRR
ncbi:teichoic acid biosynthesis protein C [Ruania zhangjianzhongii]|uniref:phage baseplate protein n=1 Tax=Ruania zhangjianzhongii TaxID=2603206 RepID=UPI0011C72902|nr:teichoic acid biosynthesis protein C [Ruania zhangjianzhongii]